MPRELSSIGTLVKAWKKASSLKLVRTSPLWRRITKKSELTLLMMKKMKMLMTNIRESARERKEREGKSKERRFSHQSQPPPPPWKPAKTTRDEHLLRISVKNGRRVHINISVNVHGNQNLVIHILQSTNFCPNLAIISTL